MPPKLARLAMLTALALLTASCASNGTKPVETTPASPSVSSPTTVSTTPPPKAPPGVWRLLPPGPVTQLQKADRPAAAAFGSGEVLLTGRNGGSTETVVFDPVTRDWRRLPYRPGPQGAYEIGDAVVWDGHEFLLLGITNSAYDPTTNSWRGLPHRSANFNAGEATMWTGHQTLGFGGGCCGDYDGMSPSYTPKTNSWSHPPTGPLGGRRGAIAVWDGKEFIVAGGEGLVPPAPDPKAKLTRFRSGAAYNPKTRSWRSIASMPWPVVGGTAVWDGTEMLVIAGRRALAYNPATDRWRGLPRMRYPRWGEAAVWDGKQLLVWGGGTVRSGGKVAPPHGEAFDPHTNRWSQLPQSPLRGRMDPVMVWTGKEMFVWGGWSMDGQHLYYDGATYTPSGHG